MKKKLNLLWFVCAALFFVTCSDDDNPTPPLTVTESGVFIVNEGTYGSGTASLSYYNANEKTVENGVFSRVNNFSLGDVAQSITIDANLKTAYVVVNNSGVVFGMDVETFASKGKITGLTSPRQMHLISSSKAYVSDLYGGKISIVNPTTYTVTGTISTGTHASTEQMVQSGKYVFTNCWSYDNKILVIDTESDKIVDSIEVGVQPAGIVLDKNDKIWVLCDGGWYGNPYGYEAPSLYRIDAQTRTVEGKMEFALGDYATKICINKLGNLIAFLLNGDVYTLSVTPASKPSSPTISGTGKSFYGIGFNPENSELYVADAVDYMQSGKVYRYNNSFVASDTIGVGVIPSAFGFYSKTQ